MKRKIRRLLLCLCALAVFSACGVEGPPDDGTEAPAALSGVFVSEGGRLFFTGDGRSLAMELSDTLAEKTGLPQGKSEGVYVFLFHNEEWRFDKAESFRIILGEDAYLFPNVVGQTDETTVAIVLPTGEIVAFEKEKEA